MAKKKNPMRQILFVDYNSKTGLYENPRIVERDFGIDPEDQWPTDEDGMTTADALFPLPNWENVSDRY